ncbi:hypothetical protein M595_1547 [Lyngbya aestuarii BL J]|uniref:DUF1517 domain-containing protein n=1 Tax=Lyngbya aestuarii BL J TaxID=1348334 RepID=U7QN64_9CYAN|nr:DUF1517 domain-containing protein [Lyngbya aestuarii]ERT08535.1 hypothetical protein M595_1547 [Lyngbya aestuarii BL J]
MKNEKQQSRIKSILKSLVAFGIVFTLIFSQADFALAARSGGRIGGGSFRTPRTYSPGPSRAPGGGYGRGFGGGFGFPFLIPFFGFGGGFGGLFGIFIFIAIANFLVRSFQSATAGDEETGGYGRLGVSVGRVQVGLLAEGRSLQDDLDRIAEAADTGSAEGRAQVLQEATLALLRHPEYWAYGAAETTQTGMESAEAQFNQWAIAERSKFTEETLSNYNNQLSGTSAPAIKSGETGNGEIVPQEGQAPGEYIVVTLVVGTVGKLELPKVNSAQELRQAVSRLGSVGAEQLLAIEVLWTPQAKGDTISTDDMLANYPNLALV